MEKARWEGITRPYSAEEVVKLRGSVNPEHTLATRGAQRLWDQLHGHSKKGYVNALGALTGDKHYSKPKRELKLFIFLAGKWQRMRTRHQVCTLTNRYTRSIRFLRS